jgi:hypothetical protein
MVLAVVADDVAVGVDALEQVGIAARHPADDEVVGLHAMLGQHVQHAVGVGRHRPVVEGQHDLLVLQRQRLLVLHAADAREFVRVDRHHAAGAERVRIAGAIGRARLRCGHRAEDQCDQDEGAPDHSRTITFRADNTRTRRQISAVVFNARADP